MVGMRSKKEDMLGKKRKKGSEKREREIERERDRERDIDEREIGSEVTMEKQMAKIIR